MIAVLERQTVVLEAILTALKDGTMPSQKLPVRHEENSTLGNDFPVSQAKISQPVAVPSKMELAVRELKSQPELLSMTGRELEASHTPMGVKISYRTWNDAKSKVASEKG